MFGHWKAIQFHERQPRARSEGKLNYRHLWLCECTLCHTQHVVQDTKLLRGLTTRCHSCYRKTITRPATSKRWTAAELECLRTLGIDEVCEKTGRTRIAVIVKRSKLGIHHGFESRTKQSNTPLT